MTEERPILTIPAYNEKLLAEIERREARIRAKLCKRYGLEEKALFRRMPNREANPEIKEARRKHKLAPIEENEFRSRINFYAKESGIELTPEKEEEVLKLCAHYVTRFDQALNMHGTIFRSARKDRERHYETREETMMYTHPLLDIYDNLISREALIRFKNFGFQDLHCQYLQGTAVKKAVDSHPYALKGIRPAAPLDRSDKARQSWLQKTLGQAQDETDALLERYRAGKDFRWHGR